MKTGNTYQFYYYFGLCLESFSFGLYSAIFAMYLQHHLSTSEKAHDILFYALFTLYVLLLITIAIDVANYIVSGNTSGQSEEFKMQILQRFVTLTFIPEVISSCCDFITQFILIYHCWIVWGRNIRVVIIPAFLAFAFLVITLTFRGITFYRFLKQEPAKPVALAWVPLGIPLVVNAVVTGLIVFKILRVFRQVKASSALSADGHKLWSVVFILIESGMAICSCQLALVVLAPVGTAAAGDAANLIGGISRMITGITPTIILVRVSFGLSFKDEKSMEEMTTSIHFASNVPKSQQESIDDGIDLEPMDSSKVTLATPSSSPYVIPSLNDSTLTGIGNIDIL